MIGQQPSFPILVTSDFFSLATSFDISQSNMSPEQLVILNRFACILRMNMKLRTHFPE